MVRVYQLVALAGFLLSCPSPSRGNDLEFRCYFPAGSFFITPRCHAIMSEAAAYINRLPLTRESSAEIEAQGYAGDLGSSFFQQNLALARANALLRELKSDGLHALKLTAIGFGNAAPRGLSNPEQRYARLNIKG